MGTSVGKSAFAKERLVATLAGTALAALAPAALAQEVTSATMADNDDGRVQDIIVTAQRREQNLQSIPVSVSAFTADELEKRNITDALGLVQFVPSLIGHNNTGLGSANTYFLRGVGTTESLATQDAPVGTYIDEIYIGRQSANNFSLFNVEQIEVLRGPQGTLFGRNTTGGAINIILRKPDQSLSGFAELSYGSYDRIGGRAGINIPVTSSLALNAAAFFNDDNGYARNVTTGERLNALRAWGARVAARFTPNDSFTWDLTFTRTHDSSSNIVNFDCNPVTPSNCRGRFASTGLLVRNNGANQLAPTVIANGKGQLPLGADTDFMMVSSNIGIDFGDHKFNLIGGYVDTRQDFLLDFFDGRAGPTLQIGQNPATGLPSLDNVSNNIILNPPVRGLRFGGFVIANKAVSKQLTIEGKLTGALFDNLVDYVAGIFAFSEENFTDFADVLGSVGSPLLLADRVVRNDTTAIAGYAQFDVNLTDKLTVTAGIRYTDEKKDFDFRDNRPSCNDGTLEASCLDTRNFAAVDVDNNPATLPIVIPLEQRARLWTPRFAVSYQAADNLLLFASATRGFKSGSQSARATQVRLLRPFAPEKVWSYEAGFKSDLFDRRVRLNVTGFWADTTGFQGGTAFIAPDTGALTFVTSNIADMRNRGIEVEAQFIPVDGLTVSLSGSYQNIKFIIDRNEPDVNAFGLLSVNAQQRECIAALAGQASPRGDRASPLLRARTACTGIVRADGTIADPVRTPTLALTVGVSYRAQLGDDWTLTPTVNANYTGDQEVGTNNLSAFSDANGNLSLAPGGTGVLGSFSEARWLVSANLALQSADGDWFAGLGCDNCFNQDYFQATLSNYSYLNMPRTWRLTVRRSF